MQYAMLYAGFRYTKVAINSGLSVHTEIFLIFSESKFDEFCLLDVQCQRKDKVSNYCRVDYCT